MVGPLRRARIDLDAIAANLQATPVDELDARADAFGHSLELVLPVARALGVAAVRVSSEGDAQLARDRGFREVRVARGGAPEVAAYGLEPGTRPALTLEGEIIAAKRVAAGAGVSYGYTYRPSAPATLALVALGYADGVPRLGSNRARARVGDRQHGIAGRIAMDQLVVDLGSGQASPGVDAVLWDDAETLAAWAAAAERSPESLTAGLGRRIRREWIDG